MILWEKINSESVVTVMTFKTPLKDRFFEDYVVGDVHESGRIVAEEDEMIAFARRFDPQPFHIDAQAAEECGFGGLIASGWYTAGLSMRLMVDHFISRAASLGSPGTEKIRWLKPVRAGDTLSVRVTILETQRSSSKPDQGFVRGLCEMLNQHGEVVMTMKTVGLFRCRDGSVPAEDGNKSRNCAGRRLLANHSCFRSGPSVPFRKLLCNSVLPISLAGKSASQSIPRNLWSGELGTNLFANGFLT